MKASISYWTLGGFEGARPILDAARKAKALGFDAIELSFGGGELTPEATEQEVTAIRKQLEAEHLPVSSVASGSYWGLSLSSQDTGERAQAVDFLKAHIRAAAWLGVDAILVVPGAVCVPWDPAKAVVPAQQVWRLAGESLRAALPLAEDLGVSICVENVWNRFLTGPFEFASFVDTFASQRLKAYFDAGNVLLAGYPEHWIEILGARIGRVHVKNFRRRDGAGTLGDFTSSLFDGDADWPAILAALRAVGYDGYLTAEMLVSEKGMPDEALAAQTATELRQILEG